MQQLKPLTAAHRLKYHKVRFYRYQWKIWREIMTALIDNLQVITGQDISEDDIKALENADLGYEYTRQSGKTTTVVHTTEEIMIFVSKLFNMPIYIGIFAPQREQAKTDFDRLKTNLSRSRKELIVVDPQIARDAEEESNAKTLVLGNGSSCYIFPVTAASKPESKSLHLIILEESQDLIDSIVNGQILPMGAAYNAVVVRIGTAGIQICDFYLKIQAGEVYVMKWREIVADRRRMYEATGQAFHLIYENVVKGLIAKHGEEDDRVRRPYNNEWLLEAGMYIPLQDLIKLRINKQYEKPPLTAGFPEYREWYRGGRRSTPDIDEYAQSHNIAPPLLAQFRTWLEEDHYFGLDTAKELDQTVLKVGRMIDKKLTVIFSMEMRGINYEDQFWILKETLDWFNIAAGSIDSTGQGDFMPDMFERNTGYKIFRIKFSLMTKDMLYKSWYQKLVNDRFAYYWQDLATADLTENTARSAGEFETETSLLLKEYKQGGYMSVHHGKDKDAHDDHPDSTALMSNAYDSYNVSSGLLDYYTEKVAGDSAAETAEA